MQYIYHYPTSVHKYKKSDAQVISRFNNFEGTNPKNL